MYNASKKLSTTNQLELLKQACGLFPYFSFLACFYHLLSKSYNFVVLLPFN